MISSRFAMLNPEVDLDEIQEKKKGKKIKEDSNLKKNQNKNPVNNKKKKNSNDVSLLI